LLNTDYLDFQQLVDKAIIIENKLKEMKKDGKHKMVFSGLHLGSNTRPHFSQPSQFVRTPFLSRAPVQVPRPQFQNQRSQFFDTASQLSDAAFWKSSVPRPATNSSSSCVAA
jgi:hypothetical protein